MRVALTVLDVGTAGREELDQEERFSWLLSRFDVMENSGLLSTSIQIWITRIYWWHIYRNLIFKSPVIEETERDGIGRQASNSETRATCLLNMTIGPSSAKQCNSGLEGPSKHFSNPSKVRMNLKRSWNRLTRFRHSVMEPDTFKAGVQSDVNEVWANSNLKG